MRFGKIDDIKSRVAAAIDASRQYLFSLQDRDEGYWCGELGADTTLVSDYILLHRLLGTEDPARTQKCANEILNRQNPDGGWPIYNDGPSNISASVKAYFALKMAGYSPDHPQLQKARERILGFGRRDRGQHLSPRFICASSGNTTTTRYRRFRPRSCCFPSGSGSTSTKSRHGRAPFWCRFRLPTPRSRSRRFLPSKALTSSLSADVPGANYVCVGRRSWSAGGISSWCSIAWSICWSRSMSVRCVRRP